MLQNYTQSSQKNQEKPQRKGKTTLEWALTDPKPSAAFIKDPRKVIFKWNRTKRKLYNNIIYFCCYKLAFPSRETLAKKVGCCVNTIDKYLEELEEENLLTIMYEHRYSSLYKIPSFFSHFIIRQLLKDILPNLRYLPATLSMLFTPSIFPQDLNDDYVLFELWRPYHPILKYLYKNIKQEILLSTIPSQEKLSIREQLLQFVTQSNTS